MPQMHLVGKAARVLGRRRGVRVPRGASVWPAAVDATFLKKKAAVLERQRWNKEQDRKLCRDH